MKGTLLLVTAAAVLTSLCRGTPVDVSDCSKTKGCFLYPADCTGSACESILTWRNSTVEDATHVTFELENTFSETGDVYVAFGITLDTGSFMTNASVVLCGNNIIVNRRNEGFTDVAIGAIDGYNLINYGLQNVDVEVANNRITCRFDRLIQPNNSYEGTYFSLTSPLYLATSTGVFLNGEPTHHARKTRTTDTVSLLSFSAPTASSSNKLHMRIAHACLMVIAWVLCASCGVVLPRYFKIQLARPELLGKAIWFRLHQILMSTAVACILGAFLCIWISKDFGIQIPRVSVARDMHVVAGLITCFLAFIQPMLALFRCSPESSKRPIFNWVHLTVGQFALFGAMMCCLLATQLPQASDMKEELLIIFVTWVISYFCVEVSLSCLNLKLLGRIKNIGTEREELNPEVTDGDMVPDGSGMRLALVKLVIYGVYCLLLLGLGCAAVTFIVLHMS